MVHSNQNRWFIRPYEPGDEINLVALFQQVYGRAITTKHWLWKMKGMPSIVENVWVVEDDGQLIGQYAVMPLPIWLFGEWRQAVIGVDAMIHPDYRRQGIWTALVQHAHRIWADAGVVYVIGLPNEKWGSRIQVLGWEYLFPLQWLARPLRPERLLAQKLHIPFLYQATAVGQIWHWWGQKRNKQHPSITVTPIQTADEDIDMVWQQVRQANMVSVIRDSQWVNWRYLASPMITYEVMVAKRANMPMGYIAYRVEESEKRCLGFVAELMCHRTDEVTRSSLLAAISEYMWQRGVDSIVTQAVPQTPLYEGFRQAGYRQGQAAFAVRLVPFADNLSLTQLRQPQNWCLMGGDFDSI